MNDEIPDDLGKRVGNLSQLPDELRKQLQIAKTDDLENKIMAVLKSLNGIANLDELLVGLYHYTQKVYKRQFISNKLYRMAQSGRVISVPKKKGVYRLPEP